MTKFANHLRFLAAQCGAALSGYAIILGLVAIIALGSVAVFGDEVKALFGLADDAIAGDPTTPVDPDDPDSDLPTATLTASASTIEPSQTSTFIWNTVHATSIEASYTLSGGCAARTASGSGPFPLGWSGLSGSEALSWSADLAGCSYDVLLTAFNNQGDDDAATATVALGVIDITPETLAFAPVLNAAPGLPVESAPAAVDNINGAVTVSVAEPDAGVAFAGSNDFTSSLAVNPGQTIKLRANAAAGANEARSIHFTAGSVSGAWDITTRAKDSEPTPLPVFAAVNNRNPGASVTSSSEIITGFDAPLAISVLNGEVSVNGGSFTAGPVDVAENATIVLRTVASSGSGAAKAVALLADGIQIATWEVGTRDYTPDAIAFGNVTVNPSTQVDSTIYAMTGYTGTNTIFVANGTVSVNGGAFTTSAPVTAGDSIQLRTTSSAAADGTGQVIVIVTTEAGGLGSWTVSTFNQTADAIAFTNQTGVEPGAVVTSNPVTLTGIEGTVTATCGVNCTGILKNGVAATPGVTTFQANDSIAIQMSAAAAFNTPKAATVTVGATTSSPWSVTTRAQDTAPTSIAFTTQTGVNPSATITSNNVVLSNFDGPITASCGVGCTGILKNGAAAVQGSTPFNPGDQIAITMTSSASFATPKTATVTVGTTASSPWSVTTRAQDTAPNAITFPASTGVDPSSSVSSSAVALTGFDAPVTATCGAGCTGILKNGAAAVQGSTQFAPNDTIAITTTASAAALTTTTASVTVGTTTSGAWSVTTRGEDTTPAGLAFADNGNATVNAASASPTLVTLSSFDGTLTATASGTGAQLNRIRGGVSSGWAASWPVIAGDQLQARGTAGSYESTRTVTVTLTHPTLNVVASDTFSLIVDGCATETKSWSGGASCSDSATAGPTGAARALSYSSGLIHGTATATCQANGSWALSGASCIRDNNDK